ncbi:hypothetical protein VYU27_002826 [Nannochloropsis oceanica]
MLHSGGVGGGARGGDGGINTSGNILTGIETPIDLATRLVRAVAQAFYADDTIVVLEALLRDRHLRDTDMETRLGVGAKQARRLLTELLEEHLIRTEDVLDESTGKRELYYYIDFSHFTNVVRYRVHLMHRELERMEREANDNQTYECPHCGRTLPLLEVQPLRNQRYGFCCPTCCNNEMHSTCDGIRFQLRPKTGVTGFEEVQALKDKLRTQMYIATDETSAASHDGIYNLLSSLEQKPLPSNLPSELLAVGVGGGQSEEDEIRRRRRGGWCGGMGNHPGGGSAGIFEDLAASTRDGGIQADEETMGESMLNVLRTARAQPSFLQGSRVIKEDTDHLEQAAGSAQQVSRGEGFNDSGGNQLPKREVEVITEAERIEAYRRAYVEALQKELGEDNYRKEGGGVRESVAAVKREVGEEQEDEDEDEVDWEEGE